MYKNWIIRSKSIIDIPMILLVSILGMEGIAQNKIKSSNLLFTKSAESNFAAVDMPYLSSLPHLRHLNWDNPLDQLYALTQYKLHFKNHSHYDSLHKFLSQYILTPTAVYKSRAKYWLFLNHMRCERFKNGIALAKDIEKEHGLEQFDNTNWGQITLVKLAEHYKSKNEYNKAIGCINKVLRKYTQNDSVKMLSIKAELLLSKGRVNKAIKVYNYVLNRSPENASKIRERLKFLQSDKAWCRPSWVDFYEEFKSYVKDKDADNLMRLANQTNFKISPIGGEGVLANLDSLKQYIKLGLSEGDPIILPLDTMINETTKKVYIYSKGWSVRSNSDSLIFLIENTPFGWQWNQIGFYTFSNVISGLIDDRIVSLKKNNPKIKTIAAPSSPVLRFPIKPPWGYGLSMATGNFPTAYSGNCAESEGYTGSYFGQHKHTGKDYYSLDFNVWENIDWASILLGTHVVKPVSGIPVTAVARGIVTRVKPEIGKVILDHSCSGDASLDYKSKYLHMDPITVEEGDYVLEGHIIGFVSDAGTSFEVAGFMSHLHFTLYDHAQNGGNSVNPSPMEIWGNRQIVFTDEFFSCIKSANRGRYSDSDGDGIIMDNCPNVYNPDQEDQDKDCMGNVCDDDIDGDGIINRNDLCPLSPNSPVGDPVGDPDLDTFYDPCDNCATIYNPDQNDANGDGQGDVCDGDSDSDGDGFLDNIDNCPEYYNPLQQDRDGDGLGDLCDGFSHPIFPIYELKYNILDDYERIQDLTVFFENLDQVVKIDLPPFCPRCASSSPSDYQINFYKLTEDSVSFDYRNLEFILLGKDQIEMPYEIIEMDQSVSLKFSSLPRLNNLLLIKPRDNSLKRKLNIQLNISECVKTNSK